MGFSHSPGLVVRNLSTARHLSDSLCTGLNLRREMVCTFNIRPSAHVSKLLVHQLALSNQVENL